MVESRTTLGRSGELIIPPEYYTALGVKPGGEVILILGEKELRILPPSRAVANAQAIVRQYVPEESSLSEALVAERRRESAHE